jgi:predicted nucleic acid-binding protein
VRLIIADTSPINYLLLIGHIDLLPSLFSRVILPAVVRDELGHPKAPPVVQDWIANPPEWVDIRQSPATHIQDIALAGLDAGEEDAIALALELHADLLLMDDEEGATAARAKGLEVTGTLGILRLAAQRRLLNLAEAFDRIKRTNFRYRQDTMAALLMEWERSNDDGL